MVFVSLINVQEMALLHSVIKSTLINVGTDYTIDSSLTVPIAATNSGDQFCLDVSTIQDNIAEGTEQFELYFENLPSEFATAGIRDTVCVSIVDDEGTVTT